MMKKAILLLFAGISLDLPAQITITSANVVNANDTAFVSVDSTGSFNIGPAGANQSWNFSSLVEDYGDTMAFLPPIGLPGADSFPSANMVIQDSDTEWIYLEKTSAGVDILGVAQVSPVDTVAYDFNTGFITFPSTYNTSFNSTFQAVNSDSAIAMDPDGPGPHPFVDSIRVRITITTESDMDAWGDITTPLGTFPSLRQNVLQMEDDSMFMYANGQWQLISPLLETMFGQQATTHDTTDREVRWWTDDPVYRFDIVSFGYDSTGNNLSEIEWLKQAPVGMLAHFANGAVSAYPNPANDFLTIEAGESPALYRIFDVRGSLVRTGHLTGQTRLDVSNLNKGIYLLEVTQDDRLINKKITIQ